MSAPVSSTRLNATGEVFGGPARVKGIYYVGAAVAGTIVIRDGGATGTVTSTIDTPASATATDYIDIPSEGLRHETDVHVTLTNVGFVTVFYG